jgi:hypothetical protein
VHRLKADRLQLGLALRVHSPHPTQQHTHQVEVLDDAGRGGARLVTCDLPACLQKQLRLAHHPLAHLAAAFAPRSVQLGHLASAELQWGDRLSQALAVCGAGARHGHQVLHRGVGADAPAADLLLDRRRQLGHQRQAPRHPARAAVEPPCQLLLSHPEARRHQCQQPPLLESGLGVGRAQRTAQQQGLDLGHVPHGRRDRVSAEARQRPHSLEAVDDHVPAGRITGYDHDRDLLAMLGQ